MCEESDGFAIALEAILDRLLTLGASLHGIDAISMAYATIAAFLSELRRDLRADVTEILRCSPVVAPRPRTAAPSSDDRTPWQDLLEESFADVEACSDPAAGELLERIRTFMPRDQPSP